MMIALLFTMQDNRSRTPTVKCIISFHCGFEFRAAQSDRGAATGERDDSTYPELE
jgi:hypothetical protein